MSKKVLCIVCLKRYKCNYYEGCEREEKHYCICVKCAEYGISRFITFPSCYGINDYRFVSTLYCKSIPMQVKNELKKMFVLSNLM